MMHLEILWLWQLAGIQSGEKGDLTLSLPPTQLTAMEKGLVQSLKLFLKKGPQVFGVFKKD